LLGGAAQSLEDYWEESKEQFRKKYLVEYLFSFDKFKIKLTFELILIIQFNNLA